MSTYDEFNEAFKRYRKKLPEIMNEKHKDAPQEVRDLMSALAALALEYLPPVIVQGGAAAVSAMRLAFELSKVLD